MRMSFENYDAINPQVWNYFKRFAFEAITAGHRRFSADCILHRIRWETSIVSAGRFKLNNNFSADYARKFIAEYPQFKGFFETRKRHIVTDAKDGLSSATYCR